MMPARIVDGSSLYKSQKLKKVPVQFRAEYANLIPLAEANGSFECEAELIWSTVYSYNRTDVTPEIVQTILDEFEKAGMLQRWEENGRHYGHWTGIEKPGRLPPPFQRAKYTNLPPLPPGVASAPDLADLPEKWSYEYHNSKTGETSLVQPPFPEIVQKTDKSYIGPGHMLFNLPDQEFAAKIGDRLDSKALKFYQIEDGIIGNPFKPLSTLPLDTQIENGCREQFGVVEPRKQWAKELKEAVKTHGYDELLAAFENWVTSQIGFTGKKPVSTFLRSLSSGITATPAVKSPALQDVETKIASISNSQVFFHNQQRPLLASLVQQYGQDGVTTAFAEFWNSVDDSSIKFAAKNFIEQAGTRIEARKAKKYQTEKRDTLAKEALAAAQAGVEKDVEEEYVEEEL